MPIYIPQTQTQRAAGRTIMHIKNDSISFSERFQTWTYNAIQEAASGYVWKDLVSLLELSEALEAFGIERAMGNFIILLEVTVTQARIILRIYVDPKTKLPRLTFILFTYLRSC